MTGKTETYSFEKLLLILLLCIMATYILTLSWHGLIDPDEGRYAEVAREMITTGDFITPHLNFVKFFDKPPLSYWLTSVSFLLFGQNEFAARFCPAICALLTIGIVFLLSSKISGKRSGYISSLVLGTSFLFFALAHTVVTDMTLTLCVTLSLAGFYLGQKGKSLWIAVFYIGMGLGVLAKGLIGIVLPIGTVLIWSGLTLNGQAFRNLFSLKGIILAMIISLPWFFLVCSRNPDFFDYFFIRQHFTRYLTTADNRYEPFWFFLPIVLIGFLPWTGFLLRSLLSLFPLHMNMSVLKEKKEQLYLFLWAAFVILFFSFSKSKLIPYILPAFPPLAMLIGMEIDACIGSHSKQKNFLSTVLTVLVLFLYGAAMAALPFFYESYNFWDIARWSLPAAFILWFGALTVIYFSNPTENMEKIVVILSLVGILNCICSVGLAVVYASDYSSKATAERINLYKTPDDLVVEYGGFDQGLPFYLGQRVILLSHSQDLDFGDAHEKDRSWFIDEEGLQDLWKKDQRVFLVARPEDTKNLRTLLGPPAKVLQVSGRRIVFSNQWFTDDVFIGPLERKDAR